MGRETGSDSMVGVEGLKGLYKKHWREFFFGTRPFEIKTASGAVLIRPRSFADIYQVQEVMNNKQYEPTEDIGRVNNAVDLGASFGDSTLWLLKRFQPETLIAVEMDPGNFRLLEQNLARNEYEGQVLTVNKAVYKEDGIVGVIINHLHKGHGMVKEGNRNQTEAITLKTLLEECGMEDVDYLKMDIEGAEKFVCTEENEDLFMERIRYVHMEVHDEFQGGQDMQKTIEYFEKLGYKVKTKPAAFKGALMLEAFNPAILKKMGKVS
jgi:FkbM family methyltransferase